MPTYDYRCRKCGHRFELFHSMSDTAIKRCPRCRGRADRVPSAGAGILFKGSGFYITDYRSRDYQEKARKEKGGGESTASDSAAKSSPAAGGEKKSKRSSSPSDRGKGGGGG